MAGDNLSSILDLIRAELERMGHPITLEEMRRASLPARQRYGTQRIYVEAMPKLQSLAQAGTGQGDDSTRSLAQRLGCSERHAYRLRQLLRG